MPNYLRPRHQNDITAVLEEQYTPISPDTMAPDKPGRLGPSQELYDLATPDRWLFNDQIAVCNYLFTQRDGRLPHETAVFSTYKKSGKTALAAGIAFAWSRVYGGEIYFLANAKEQAKDRAFLRLVNFFTWLSRTDKDTYDRHVQKLYQDTIELKEPYSTIQALPCAAGSQAGSFVSLSVWDELWAYSDRESLQRLWAEFSPTPQLAGKTLRLVVTYAGYYGESGLLWNIYDATVHEDSTTGEPQGIRALGLERWPAFVSPDGGTFAFWAHPGDIYRPWITERFLEGRRNDPSIPKQQYLRLWENRWVTGQDQFIDIGLVDAAGERGLAMGLAAPGRM